MFDVLAGRDNCGGVGPSVEECAAGEEPGNQLAGYDIRYSTKLLDHPVALYFTAFAEDGDSKGGLSILGEERLSSGHRIRARRYSVETGVYLQNGLTLMQSVRWC